MIIEGVRRAGQRIDLNVDQGDGGVGRHLKVAHAPGIDRNRTEERLIGIQGAADGALDRIIGAGGAILFIPVIVLGERGWWWVGQQIFGIVGNSEILKNILKAAVGADLLIEGVVEGANAIFGGIIVFVALVLLPILDHHIDAVGRFALDTGELLHDIDPEKSGVVGGFQETLLRRPQIAIDLAQVEFLGDGVPHIALRVGEDAEFVLSGARLPFDDPLAIGIRARAAMRTLHLMEDFMTNDEVLIIITGASVGIVLAAGKPIGAVLNAVAVGAAVVTGEEVEGEGFFAVKEGRIVKAQIHHLGAIGFAGL